LTPKRAGAEIPLRLSPFVDLYVLGVLEKKEGQGKEKGISVVDGFSDCAASVPVKIQRRRAGAWRTVGTATTNDTGAYKKRIKDRPGRYRALAPKVSLNDGADICSRAVSPVRRHRH
jgi:hypothetical protein